MSRALVWIVGVVAALIVAPCANAQLINLDFSRAGGQPSDLFGAAPGQAGFWNVYVPGAPAHLLSDLAGGPTDNATVVGPMGPIPDVGINDPLIDGDAAALLEDGFNGGGDVFQRISLRGIDEGTYFLFLYGLSPNLPNDSTFFSVEADGDVVLLTDASAGGAWPGGFQAGVTHVIYEVTTTNGLIDIDFGGGIFGDTGYFSGLQLSDVPSPGTGALMALGTIALMRRRRRM